LSPGFDHLQAVGISERLRESLVLIAQQLGGPQPPEFGRRNAAASRVSAPDGHTIRIIRECTDIDHALYADELRRFEDKLKDLN